MPKEWAGWTLRQLITAYKGWREVNVSAPWERARAISFYALVPHVKPGTFKTWEDVFPLDGDKKRKKKQKPKFKAYVTEMTAEEKQLYEKIMNEAVPINNG